MSPIQIAEQLGQTGLCVCPDFIKSTSLIEYRNEIMSLQAAGEFHRAGVGQAEAQEVRNLVRSDDVYWLDRKNQTPVQTELWGQLDLLKQAFNRSLFLGLKEFNGHYANYPEGGFYQRHRDSLPFQNNRIVTLVIYLNQDWKSSDGGQLRIYDQATHTDVDPIGGTLVCFMSQESEHEVCASQASRLSFTGWFTN